MSTEKATARAKEATKEAIKSVKEHLDKAQESAHKAFDRAAPAVTKSLDSSLATGASVFNKSMKTIDTRTEKEQLELLKAYRKFIDGQAGFLDSRIRDLEDRASKKQ